MKAKEKGARLAKAATIFLFAGSGILLARAGRQYEIVQTQKTALASAVPETDAAADEEILLEETPAETEPEEKESESEYQPSPDKLNLAFYYPEGSDTSDIINSYAGQVFQELTILDSEWLADLYELADVKPADMAVRLGKDPSSVRGSYNPKDDDQNPDDPETWILDSWKKINVSFTDGDGKRITGFSNVKDILAMASVYTYYAGMLDHELFSQYARQLWENSHSYTLSISDVYYCSGCLDKTDEEIAQEEEALESAAISMLSAEEEQISEGGSDSETSAAASSAETAVLESENAAGINTVPSSEAGAAMQQRSLNVATAADAAPASGTEEIPRIIRRSSSAETSTEDSFGDGSLAGSESQAAASSSDAVSLSAAPLQDGNSPGAAENGSQPSESEASDGTHEGCPGHVDLNIRVKILGLSDSSGLYSADSIGSAAETEDSWDGWTEENRSFAQSISSQDWFADYGLSVSSLSLSDPLTSEEIQSYMDSLPADLSQTRRDIIYFALNSVGKVPYYWGGKASYPGYEGNNFGALVSSDEQGRVLKGLDCSGWISWVYWSVTGERLAGESTSSLILCGEKISRSKLQPGDIVVRTGTSAHVVMFLGWSADGRMNVIHESSASVNNVTIKTMDAAWPYYRKLVD